MRRFVLLEHRWDGVHWDFMIEDADGLRTWAIDAPIRPGVDLPARALGDHRRVYLDYEGEVSGGRGSVRRAAEGGFEGEVWRVDRVEGRLEGDHLKGRVVLSRSVTGEPSSPWTFRFEGKVD